MVQSAEDAHFHWLASGGKRLSGSERELRAALSTGALSATTLVWRMGWAEWLPANRVAELTLAIPEGNRESALKPRRDPAVVNPPAAPGERMTAVLPPTPLSAGVSAPPARNSVPARAQPPPAPVRKPSAPPPAAPVAASAAVNTKPPSPAPPPLAVTPKRETRAVLPGPTEAARDTLSPSSFGVIGSPRRAQPTATVVRREPAAAVVPVRARSPLPTLTEEGTIPSATATLRPPGAVPPPARGVPAVPALDSSSSGSFLLEKRAAAMTPIPSFGPPGGAIEAVPPAALPPRLEAEFARLGTPSPSSPNASPAPSLLTPALDEPAAPANTLPPVVNKALLVDAPETEIEPALESTLEMLQQVPPEARRTPVEPIPAARPPLNSASEDVLARALHRHSLVKIGRIAVDSRSVVMVLSALCGALLVALIALYFARPRAPEGVEASSPSASASANANSPPAPIGCRLAQPAALIAPNIERNVPPYVSKLGTEAGLALGFAASKTKGVGLRLDPSTLDTIPAFEEDGKDAVRGVIPLTRSGSLAFFVDRDDSALRSAHTVDEVPPFTLGVSDAGFSRVVAGSTSVVWPLDTSLKITEPRSAAIGSFGYGVTFRRGGQAGSVMLGFVASDGTKKSELTEIPNAPKLLGTPVIAGSAAGVLVAFAGRDSADAAWKVFASFTEPGAAAGPARQLVTGSGGGAISPTLSPLPPDRWLLQWTEGVSGQYQVRVQSLARDLSALGPPVMVSPKGANAGQGSLGAFAGGAASLFILTTAGHDELWGATLSCP